MNDFVHENGDWAGLAVIGAGELSNWLLVHADGVARWTLMLTGLALQGYSVWLRRQDRLDKARSKPNRRYRGDGASEGEI